MEALGELVFDKHILRGSLVALAAFVAISTANLMAPNGLQSAAAATSFSNEQPTLPEWMTTVKSGKVIPSATASDLLQLLGDLKKRV